MFQKGTSQYAATLGLKRVMMKVSSKFDGEPLASVWEKWITKHHHKGWPSGQLPYSLLTRVLLGETQTFGYLIPPRRQMEDVLARGMEPLEVIQSGHHG